MMIWLKQRTPLLVLLAGSQIISSGSAVNASGYMRNARQQQQQHFALPPTTRAILAPRYVVVNCAQSYNANSAINETPAIEQAKPADNAALPETYPDFAAVTEEEPFIVEPDQSNRVTHKDSFERPRKFRY